MKESSLIELLNSLTDAEWGRLGGKLPATSIDARKLYDHLTSIKPFGKGALLEKNHVYACIFKGQPYNDQKLRDAMSALLALAKEVISEAELNANPYQQQLLLMQALRKRGIQQTYLRTFNKAIKDTAQQADYTEDGLLHQYHMAQEREEYFALQQDRQPDQALQDRMHYLDRFYILSKLKLTCEQLNRLHILQADYQPMMLTEIINLLEAQPHYLEHPAILLYYRVLQTLLNPQGDELYGQLVAALAAYESVLPVSDARNLYRYAQNYCIRMINKGQAAYFQLLLELYQKQLHNKLLLPDGIIDHTDYKNIVTVGLRLKDYEWTAAFIEQYKPHLPEAVREAAWLYNHANYLYESGALAKAGALLINQNFADIYYNLSARHLLLKIFYDERETEALTYQIESFRLYLLRNKTISAANRASNLNFLKVMKNLASIRERQNYLANALIATKLVKIEHAIGHYNPLANKNWLLEQIASIKEGVLK